MALILESKKVTHNIHSFIIVFLFCLHIERGLNTTEHE